MSDYGGQWGDAFGIAFFVILIMVAIGGLMVLYLIYKFIRWLIEKCRKRGK